MKESVYEKNEKSYIFLLEREAPMAQEKLTFQQSLDRLEQIVAQLSSPQVELEKAMDLFKEGLALSKSCQSQLEAFETQMNALIEEDV